MAKRHWNDLVFRLQCYPRATDQKMVDAGDDVICVVEYLWHAVTSWRMRNETAHSFTTLTEPQQLFSCELEIVPFVSVVPSQVYQFVPSITIIIFLILRYITLNYTGIQDIWNNFLFNRLNIPESDPVDCTERIIFSLLFFIDNQITRSENLKKQNLHFERISLLYW